MKILLIVLAVLLAAGMILGFVLAGFVMTGKRQTLAEALTWQRDHYDISFYDALEKENYTVISELDGYVLHAQLLRCPEGSDRYVICSHGYTDNRIGSLKYARFYLDLGFHVIMYDLRGHGENEPAFTSYGIREARDLMSVIRDARERFGEDIVLGIHGESLGAATTVTALQYRPEVAFAVADCPFADIENVLHLPEPVRTLTDLGAKLRFGYFLHSMRPIDALPGNQVPMLVIHGSADDFILPSNSERIRDAAEGKAKLILVEGAGHAESALKDPAGYEEHLRTFLQANGILD